MIKGRFLKIRSLAIALLVISGFFGLSQKALAEDSCMTNCSSTFAGGSDLPCCGGVCDVQSYCVMICSCGNGAIDMVCGVAEQCDDGNAQAGDGCDQDCHTESQ